MTRDELVESTNKLVKPQPFATEEFYAKREHLAARVNRIMSERPDLVKLVGRDGKQMSEDNNRNFSLFMESLFQEFSGKVLVDTALWAFRTYRSHGFQPIYWPANLSTWTQILKEELSKETFEAISPFYEWLIVHVPVFTQLTDAEIMGGGKSQE